MWDRLHLMKTRKHSDVIRELLPMKGKTILDIGCGDGGLTRLLARGGAQATGVDIDDRQLSRARAAEPVPGAHYAVGRGERLDNADGSLDAVVYMNSLHHVPEPDIAAALAEAARVLRPGGILLVIEPLAEGPNFALVQPVEDETGIRAVAYAALKAAAGFREDHEEVYDAPVKYPDYATFEKRMRAVDPRRAPRVEQLRPQLQETFERLGRKDGADVWFSQPTRVNRLIRV
jgi:ubiquinone/menaquinone biosynthesis C-methylase UbiE